MNIHEKYISRCIELGKLGIGNTYPNPSVGSCLVVDDKIIGEGYTSKAGGNHAEVNAINSVEDKSLLMKPWSCSMIPFTFWEDLVDCD